MTGNTQEEKNAAEKTTYNANETQKKMKEFIKIRKSFYNRIKEEDIEITQNNEFRH